MRADFGALSLSECERRRTVPGPHREGAVVEASDPILVVEYKGEERWMAAHDGRVISGLWASLSDGRRRSVMVKNREWGLIGEVRVQ